MNTAAISKPDEEIESANESDDDDGDSVHLEPLHLDAHGSAPSKLERQEWVYAIYELNADVRHQIQSMPFILCAMVFPYVNMTFLDLEHEDMKNMRAEAAPDTAEATELTASLAELVIAPQFLRFRSAVKIAHETALPTRKGMKRRGAYDPDLHGSIPRAGENRKQKRSSKPI